MVGRMMTILLGNRSVDMWEGIGVHIYSSSLFSSLQATQHQATYQPLTPSTAYSYLNLWHPNNASVSDRWMMGQWEFVLLPLRKYKKLEGPFNSHDSSRF